MEKRPVSKFLVDSIIGHGFIIGEVPKARPGAMLSNQLNKSINQYILELE
jgi:hypothetical protein